MNKLIITVLLLAGILGACDDGGFGGRPYIPDEYIHRQLNLNTPEYSQLNHPGGYAYLDEGHRGVIVYHNHNGTYSAFDRACTYHPDEKCAQVTVDSSALFFHCGSYNTGKWKDCCGSMYNPDGTVLQGPAQYPLKRYHVTKDGGYLWIDN